MKEFLFYLVDTAKNGLINGCCFLKEWFCSLKLSRRITLITAVAVVIISLILTIVVSPSGPKYGGTSPYNAVSRFMSGLLEADFEDVERVISDPFKNAVCVYAQDVTENEHDYNNPSHVANAVSIYTAELPEFIGYYVDKKSVEMYDSNTYEYELYSKQDSAVEMVAFVRAHLQLQEEQMPVYFWCIRINGRWYITETYS